MKRMLLLLISFIFVCAVSFAQEVVAPVQVTTTEETTAPATSAKPRFDIGAGYWWTSGSLDSYVVASEDDGVGGIFYKKGDRLSHLDNDLDAGLFVINAEAYLFWRLYADAFIGWGDFEGEHKDYDWFPQYDPNPYQLSKSDADGDVVTWNANAYFRILEEPEDKGFLDVSFGYFYYEDDIEHLRNSTLLIYDYETVDIPISGHDSQSKHTFDGLRLGARGKIRLHDRVAIKASGGIVPWLNVEEDAYWNLRGSPNTPGLYGMDIGGEAEGTAFDLTIGIELKITKYLFVEAGYKYINLDSDLGDGTRDWADGTHYDFPDSFEAEAERSGFYAMGRLKI